MINNIRIIEENIRNAEDRLDGSINKIYRKTLEKHVKNNEKHMNSYGF